MQENKNSASEKTEDGQNGPVRRFEPLIWSETEVPPPNKKRQFWTGMAWGAVPLALFLISGIILRIIPDPRAVGSISIMGVMLGFVGYIIALITAIIYLFKEEKRSMGYGLLIMVLVTPIVAVGGCSAIGVGANPPA